MSGMIYLGEAGQRLVAPAIAALALPWIGYAGVIWMDVSTFATALLTLAVLPLPGPQQRHEREPARHILAQGWRFLRDRPGLLWLQGFFALSQFLGGFLPILMLPALLELTGSPSVTGVVMACGGAGLVAGALYQAARPARNGRVQRTLMYDVCASCALLALAMGAVDLGPIWVAITGFVFLFFHVLESGVSQDLWQRKVPQALQGRVFAIRRAISWSLVPVCYVLAGPIVDDLLTPGLEGHTSASPKLVAMLLVMGGSAILRAGALVPAAWSVERLRRLERDLEDHV